MAKHVSIIVGSVLGATEYVADALQAHLEEKGYQCEIHLEPNLSSIAKDSHWLVCTSTHGAGDLPDNIEPFAQQLDTASLESIDATIIGLGDTSYDTYCNAAITMETKLKKAGATLNHEPLHIDVLQHPIPEEIALEWIADKF